MHCMAASKDLLAAARSDTILAQLTYWHRQQDTRSFIL